MRIPLASTEQLLPFPTAEELLAKKTAGVVAVAPHATVLSAMQRMADRHLGFLVVLDAGRLVGVLSERDCARRVVLGQLSPGGTAVREIMTRRVYTVSPQAKLSECAKIMHEHAVRHLPVVEREEVVGVLSLRDLMSALIERHERLLRRLEEERLALPVPDQSSY